MNFESVEPYFRAFSGVDGEENTVFIKSAIDEIGKKLKDPVYQSLECISALCGACANLHYIIAKKSRESEILTRGGKVAVTDDKNNVISSAERLFLSHKNICREYLIDDDFYFESTEG